MSTYQSHSCGPFVQHIFSFHDPKTLTQHTMTLWIAENKNHDSVVPLHYMYLIHCILLVSKQRGYDEVCHARLSSSRAQLLVL